MKTETFTPLKDLGDVWIICLQNGKLVTDPNSAKEWTELRVEKDSSSNETFFITYADSESSSREVYRGQIPSREFFLDLLWNIDTDGMGAAIAMSVHQG